MNYSQTICGRHDDIEEDAKEIESLSSKILKAVSYARDAGISMERALEERKEEVQGLEEKIRALEAEIETLKSQLALDK
jgi:flagellar motility protein MotE (MotC chaperone)